MFVGKSHNGINYKESNGNKGWQIVHDGNKIIYLNCSNSKVATTCSVYFTPNFRSMKQYIQTNDLDVDSIDLKNYDKLYNEIIGQSLLPNDQDLINFLNTFKTTEDAD